MTGDWAKHVAAGDSIDPSAVWHNNVTRVAEDALRAKGQSLAPELGRQLPEGLLYVKNLSGADVPRFGIMTLRLALFDDKQNLSELQNNYAFTGSSPAGPASVGYGQFCVAYEPIATNAVGRCWVFGVCPAQINFTNDNDYWADAIPNDPTQLQSNPNIGGAFVLWKQQGTGKQWALIRIGNAPAPAWIKITSIVPPPSLGSANGGGGYYNARLLRNGPAVIDPTNDLTIPKNPNEVFPATDDILAENSLEANLGDPPSHWVPPGTIVRADFVGMSNEATPRPVYRFSFEPLEVIVKIESTDSGHGQYGGHIYGGVTTAKSATNFAMPAGLVAGVSALICNIDEDGGGGWTLATGSFAMGKLMNFLGTTAVVMIHGGVGSGLANIATGASNNPTQTGSGSSGGYGVEWLRWAGNGGISAWIGGTMYNPTLGSFGYYAYHLNFDGRGILVTETPNGPGPGPAWVGFSGSDPSKTGTITWVSAGVNRSIKFQNGICVDFT